MFGSLFPRDMSEDAPSCTTLGISKKVFFLCRTTSLTPVTHFPLSVRFWVSRSNIYLCREAILLFNEAHDQHNLFCPDGSVAYVASGDGILGTGLACIFLFGLHLGHVAFIPRYRHFVLLRTELTSPSYPWLDMCVAFRIRSVSLVCRRRGDISPRKSSGANGYPGGLSRGVKKRKAIIAIKSNAKKKKFTHCHRYLCIPTYCR
jgi:hypothetical protein